MTVTKEALAEVCVTVAKEEFQTTDVESLEGYSVSFPQGDISERLSDRELLMATLSAKSPYRKNSLTTISAHYFPDSSNRIIIKVNTEPIDGEKDETPSERMDKYSFSVRADVIDHRRVGSLTGFYSQGQRSASQGPTIT